MTADYAGRTHRFDRTLRTVMWLDAFLSVALVVVCVLASPIVAAVGVPDRIRLALAVAALTCAVLLAAFGAITAIVLMLRMQAGQYLLPVGLRLPLPAPMRPMSREGSRVGQTSTIAARTRPTSSADTSVTW